MENMIGDVMTPKTDNGASKNRETVRETGKGRKGSGLAHDEGGI
jgi:hypothetical protein